MSEQQMIFWVIGGAVVLLVLVCISRAAPTARVRLADLQAIFEKTRLAGKDPSYATLGFYPLDGKMKDDVMNIQFSREEGRMGVDWFLLGSRNVRDVTVFTDFALSRGYRFTEEVAPNGNRSVRVENGDLVSLVEGLLRDCYGVTPATGMDLLYNGFEWP